MCISYTTTTNVILYEKVTGVCCIIVYARYCFRCRVIYETRVQFTYKLRARFLFFDVIASAASAKVSMT